MLQGLLPSLAPQPAQRLFARLSRLAASLLRPQKAMKTIEKPVKSHEKSRKTMKKPMKNHDFSRVFGRFRKDFGAGPALPGPHRLWRCLERLPWEASALRPRGPGSRGGAGGEDGESGDVTCQGPGGLRSYK